MELEGRREIRAPRAVVWAMLNDSAILQKCIVGCESLEPIGENGYAAKVRLGIGPIRATFAGTVELTDMIEPESFRISGAGQGGVAGFAKGGATVKLEEIEGGTILTYKAQAQVGGKIAQLGARLIQSTAGKLAGQFFSTFADLAPVAEQ